MKLHINTANIYDTKALFYELVGRFQDCSKNYIRKWQKCNNMYLFTEKSTKTGVNKLYKIPVDEKTNLFFGFGGDKGKTPVRIIKINEGQTVSLSPAKRNEYRLRETFDFRTHRKTHSDRGTVEVPVHENIFNPYKTIFEQYGLVEEIDPAGDVIKTFESDGNAFTRIVTKWPTKSGKSVITVEGQTEPYCWNRAIFVDGGTSQYRSSL